METTVKRGRGRPRVPGKPEKAVKAMEHMRTGKTVRQACELVGLDRADFYKVINEDEELYVLYSRAREAMQDAIVDDFVHVADTEADPARARVKIDAMKWLACKILPKKYGEKITHAGDSDNPLAITSITRTIVKK